MFQYEVCGVFEAHGRINDRWPTRIVTILGEPDAHLMPSMGDHHYIASFDDAEAQDDFNWVMPTADMVREVLAWTSDLTDDDRLLVHCRAGKSRSTAILIGVLIQHGMGPLDALDTVRAIRPKLIPNRLMIGFIDDHLGLDGVLKDVVARFYKQREAAGYLLPNRGGLNL